MEKKILIAIFFITINYLLVDHVFHIIPQNDQIEKVLRAGNNNTKPSYDNRLYKIYNAAKEWYYTFDHINENFSGRSFLIKQFMKLKIDFYKVPSPIPDVIIGKENFIYPGDNIDHSLLDFLNAQPLEQVDMDSITNNINLNKKWLTQKAIQYYVFIIPNKSTIYPEYFPKYFYKLNTESRLQQLVNYNEQTGNQLPVFDLTRVLLRGKKRYKHNIYYSTDTHWNNIGAYIAYAEIIKVICKDIAASAVKQDEFVFKKFRATGYSDWDLAYLLHRSDLFTDDVVLASFKEKQTIRTENISYKSPFLNSVKPSKRTYNAQKSKKIIFFSDSFTERLKPFFDRTFGQCLYMRQTVLDKSLINAEKPDIVVQIVVERNFGKALTKNSS